VKVERSIRLAASPERVYEVIMDPACLERWVTIHCDLEDAPPRLTSGSKLTQRLQLAGRRFTVTWRVVENDPARRIVWEGRGPMRSHAGVTYELAPSTDGGTLFTYTNEFSLPGGPLRRVAEPVVKRVTAGELDRSLSRLRELVE
jgi:uncharacterized protein YndB with AHSA1/START domain